MRVPVSRSNIVAHPSGRDARRSGVGVACRGRYDEAAGRAPHGSQKGMQADRDTPCRMRPLPPPARSAMHTGALPGRAIVAGLRGGLRIVAPGGHVAFRASR